MTGMNILTVDVEDWAGSSLFLLSLQEAETVKRYLTGNTKKETEVEDGIRRVLDYLERNDFKATFFVVGETARIHKALIRDIREKGHEIASHGMTHTVLSGLTVSQLDKELTDSKRLLEDISGAPVHGFRAPNLAPFPDIPVFFQRLHESGYTYDSSTVTGSPEEIAASSAGQIREFPVTTVKCGFLNLPLGGTYLKLMSPGTVSKKIRRLNSENRPALLYFHPYELSSCPLRWPHPTPSLEARFSLFIRNRRSGHHMGVLNRLAEHCCFQSIEMYQHIT